MSKSIKRILVVILIIGFLIPNVVIANQVSYLDLLKPAFDDMPENWATEALVNAVDNGLLSGFNGLVKPDNNLKRAEMATIINRALNVTQKGDISKFTDVNEDDWYYEDMSKAYAIGTFEGFNNQLKPEDDISREEAFVVIARALSIEGSNKKPGGYKDLDEVSSWAENHIYSMINNGYIKGNGTHVKPKEAITRAEFAKVMDNIVKYYVTKPGIYNKQDKIEPGNIIINVPGVILKDLNIKGDIIIGDGAHTGDIILDNVNIDGRLVVRGSGELILKGDTHIEHMLMPKGEIKTEVKVEEKSIVEDVVIYSETHISGEGLVKKVSVYDGGSNTIVETIGTEVRAGKGAENVTGINGEIIKPGNSMINKLD